MFTTYELMFTAYELMFMTYELMFATYEHRICRQEILFSKAKKPCTHVLCGNSKYCVSKV